MITLVLASALIAVTSAALEPVLPVSPQAVLPQVLPSPLPTYRPLAAPVYNPQPGIIIPILRSENDIEPDGRYSYAFETANGIVAEESGTPLGPGPEAPLAVRGSYSYTSPEGIPIQITYIADETGFHPSGNILASSLASVQPILRSPVVPRVASSEGVTPIPPLLLVSALIAVASAQVIPVGVVPQVPIRPAVLPTPLPTYNPVLSPLPTYRPTGYSPVPSAPVIPILRYESDAAPDGSHYQYSYETANGIVAHEVGDLAAPVPDAPLRVSGSYAYTSPEGLPVQITYTADENGFQPSGDVLPTPPPIPEAILRSIEYNLANPEPEQPIAPLVRNLVLVSALLAVASAQILPGGLRRYPVRPIAPTGLPTYNPVPSAIPVYNPVPSPVPTYNPIPAPVPTRLPVGPAVYNQVASGPIIPILRLDNNAAPDGSHYDYAYETGNGISVQESGDQVAPAPDAPIRVTGSYTYTSPEGLPVQITYTADENGFQPSGEVLPTPPPIPEAILRSIEFNLAHPEPEQRVVSPAVPFLRNLQK
ncbi:hypothetical protein NQ315_004932 [Exocentrus adspersus]|uniref:Uncharacterized protein n=1 Tax=Exocentrus adspersus TaxID=1586481 RepID=A0AAV8W2C8_9CUCU|nr:hypothetical protein NQ315_004932 [Exocentrus adspersus]